MKTVRFAYNVAKKKWFVSSEDTDTFKFRTFQEAWKFVLKNWEYYYARRILVEVVSVYGDTIERVPNPAQIQSLQTKLKKCLNVMKEMGIKKSA